MYDDDDDDDDDTNHNGFNGGDRYKLTREPDCKFYVRNRQRE